MIPVSDPMLPTATLHVAGEDYTVSLDFGTLIDAEEELIAAGHDVSLLRSLPPLSASKTRTLFAIAVRRHHPQLKYEDARKLFGSDIQAVNRASNLFCDLWLKSMPEQDGAKVEADPTQYANSEESRTGNASSSQLGSI